MDVSAWLLKHTPPRPLVVAVPGGTEARLAVERVTREHGWRTAVSPAEANMLVVAGPADGAVEPYVARVWRSMPAPRARADVHTAADTERELDAAHAALRDVDHQRREAAADRAEPADHHGGHAEHGGGHMQHGHEGHDMGAMSMPGDVPMADRAEDRDGLMLDQLHVPLGPVLTDWPAGLVVRTTLQGDVVQHATVEVLGHGATTFWSTPDTNTARALDSCARLLSVAGWADAATTARRLRDAALAGALPEGQPARWARRVRRSRTLRWLLAGVGTTEDAPPELHGDALARLDRWLTDPPVADRTQWTVEHLPRLLEGSELATARLIVASLDPDVDALDRHEVHHG